MRLDQHRTPQFRSFETLEEEPQWHRAQDDAQPAEPAPAEEAPGTLLRDMARYSPAIALPPPPPVEPQRQLPRLDDVREPAPAEPQQHFEPEAGADGEPPHDSAPAEALVVEAAVAPRPAPAPAATSYEVVPSEGDAATFLPDIFTRPDPSTAMNLQASAFDLLNQARAQDSVADNYAMFHGEGNDWDDYTPSYAMQSLPGYSSAPEPALAPEPAPPADFSRALPDPDYYPDTVDHRLVAGLKLANEHGANLDIAAIISAAGSRSAGGPMMWVADPGGVIRSSNPESSEPETLSSAGVVDVGAVTWEAGDGFSGEESWSLGADLTAPAVVAEAAAPAPAPAAGGTLVNIASGPTSLDPENIKIYVNSLEAAGVISSETAANTLALSNNRPTFNSGAATPAGLPGSEFSYGFNGDKPVAQQSSQEGSDSSGYGHEATHIASTLTETAGEVANLTHEVIETSAASDVTSGLSRDVPALGAESWGSGEESSGGAGGSGDTQAASNANSSNGGSASSQQSIYSERYQPVPGTAGSEPAGGRDKLIAAPDLTPLPSEFTPTTLDGRPGRSEPYRDVEGKVYFRTFDADGKEVGLVSQAAIGERPDAVVVNGRRADSAEAQMTPVTDAFGSITGFEQPLPVGETRDPVLIQQMAGGLTGAVVSLAKAADGAVRVAGNTVLQIGDILTLGVNHDDPTIQQAWIEQGALADSVVRLVTEPITTFNKVEANLAERSDKAEQLRSQGRHFEAAVVDGEMAADVAQAVLGVAGAARGGVAKLRGWGESRVPIADTKPAVLSDEMLADGDLLTNRLSGKGELPASPARSTETGGAPVQDVSGPGASDPVRRATAEALPSLDEARGNTSTVAGDGPSVGAPASVGDARSSVIPSNLSPETAAVYDEINATRAGVSPRLPRDTNPNISSIVSNPDGTATVTIKSSDPALNGLTVEYSAEGFPDYRPYLYQDGVNTVQIKMTGSRNADFAQANKLAGYGETANDIPIGYTWHHNENLGVMQLVNEDVHALTPHTGGVAIWQRAFGLSYDVPL